MSFSNLLSGLLGGGSGSPLQSVLMNLLGGQQSASGRGGLGGLASSFQQAGLGNIIQSWIGHGPNQPVEPGQLQQVFGEERVQEMANQSGMAPTDFLSQLSQHLPRAVDGLTPNGRLPDEGSVSV
jgi:uncharacterized protein YidB (DUF937 family)